MPANNQLQGSGSISLGDLEDMFNLNNTSAQTDFQYYIADDTDPWIGTISKTASAGSNMDLSDYYGSSPDTGRLIVDQKDDDDNDYQNGFGSVHTNFVDPENPYDPGYSFGWSTNTTPGLGIVLQGIYAEWYWDAYPGGRMFIIAFRSSSAPSSSWDELYLRFARGPYQEVNITFYESDGVYIQTGGEHSNHTSTYNYIWHESDGGSVGANVVNAQAYFEEASDNDYDVFFKFKKT
jgi:hypothetical protein